jgi:tetratricopeptide (TPR) repeat protein
MMDSSLYVEPRLSPLEHEELAHIAYFLSQLESLRERNLIPLDSYAVIVAEYNARKENIMRHAKAEAALHAARTQMRPQPQDALAWADMARDLDPTRQEAWILAIEAYTRLGQHDDALALCAEAAEKFPALQSKLAQLQRDKEWREAEQRRKSEQQCRDRVAADLLTQAREALSEGRDHDVVTLCAQLLEIQPNNPDALSALALAHDHLGNFDESIALYRTLQRLQPYNEGWRVRLREVQRRRAEANQTVVTTSVVSRATEVATTSEPVLTWSSIAGEFLKEHWMKLILCLGGLLIVVSSTVVAHHVLQEKFWLPETKCILALFYTLSFAALGYGLVRWGAAGAGRMMLLTTLLVVPINFALAGELRLLAQPTMLRLFLFALDAAALLFLSWTIAAGVDKRGVALFAPAFFVLSALNALITSGIEESLGRALFLLTAGVFLGAVWRLNTQLEASQNGNGTESVPYFTLGLLAYAFLFGTLRTGVFVLHLHATLYALPVMFTAIACVHTAHYLPKFEKDVHRVHLLRFGGFVLAGAAFALALARPQIPSSLYSGNTLATALLGLALFATSLRVYRHPSYLYCAFAALFVAYFGVGYFVGDLMREIETAASRALGYEEQLPPAFKSLNGIVFNVVLALLSLLFARKWKEERLARHCHYIGLPLALAACVLSCSEPMAATMCLSAYALLFALAAWLFAEPLLIYPACASFAGAVFFGSTLMSASVSTQALGAAGIAFIFWAACSMLANRQVNESYRAPLIYSALAMSGVALWAATVSVLTQHVTFPTALTFFAVALLYVLVGVVYPRTSLAYLAVITANVGYALATIYADRKLQLHFSAAHFGIAASALGVVMCGLGEWLKRIAGSPALRRNDQHSRASLYVFPLFHLALAQVALCITLCGFQVFGQAGDHRGLPLPISGSHGGLPLLIAIALTLCAATLAMISAFAYRVHEFAYLAVWMGMTAFGAAVLSGLIAFDVQPLPAALAVAFGAFALLLRIIGERIVPTTQTPKPVVVLYRAPFLHTAFIAVGLTWWLCALNWNSFALVGIALTLTTLTLAASTRIYPVTLLAHLATASALGAWSCGFEIATGGMVTEPAVYGVVVVTFALILLTLNTLFTHYASRITYHASPFASALPDFSLVAVFAAVVLAVGEGTNDIPLILTFALAAVAFMWLTRFRRKATLVHFSLISAIVSALCICYRYVSRIPDVDFGWMAVAMATIAVILWCVGFVCKRRDVDNFYATPCFVMSLLMTVGVFGLVALTFLFVEGGWLKPAVLPLCSIALLLNALTYLLLTAVWRIKVLTYAAIVSLICAVHLPFKGDHGLLMATEAIALWLIGFSCQRGITRMPDDAHTPIRPYAHTLYSRPLFVCSLLLTLLAVRLAYSSPLAMSLVAVAFLLMVKSFPAAEWLYAVVASVGCAVYFRFFAGPPDAQLVIASVVAAFALWTLGVIVQRVKSVRNGTESVPYEYPLFNCALIASLIVIALRIGGGIRDADWTEHIALLPVLAAFYLLMLRPYPHRVWVHVAVALVTLSIGLKVYPLVVSPLTWLLVGMVLANVALLVQRGLERVELPLCQRLGVRFDKYSEVPGAWSLAAFGISAVLVVVLVVVTVLMTVFLLAPFEVVTTGAWWSVLLALLLTAVYVLLNARSLDTDKLLMSLYAVLLLTVWWCGAPTSPLGISASAYYSIATAALAFVTVLTPTRSKGVERIAFFASLFSAMAVVALMGHGGYAALMGVSTLLMLTVFYILLAQRWNAEWLVYLAQAAFVGSYLHYKIAHALPSDWDAIALVMFCFIDFALSQVLERLRMNLYARPTLYFSLLLPFLPLALALKGERLTLLVFSTATFYGVACYQKQWKTLGYAAAVFYNAFLWLLWSQMGVELSRHPQFYLIPVGLSAILFAEVNRRELGREYANAIRSIGLMVIYVSTAVPMWQSHSLGVWLTLLLLSLLGIFVGIGLRLQSFLWLGLVCFVFDVVYQLGWVSMNDALARWGIMLTIGLLLVAFVALNEKKRILETMREYYEQVKKWE